jgi:phytoene synthase
LGNILRDVGEDAAGGRCYLPSDWLAERGIAPEDVMAAQHRAALVEIAARMAVMAALYEASARAGAARLPFRCRWAVLAAAGIYGGIARRVVARGPKAWDARVTTGKAEKIGFLARGFFGALRGSPAKVPLVPYKRAELAQAVARV